MPTLSLPDGGPAHSQSRAQWRLSGRQLSRLAWAGTLIAAGVLWAAVVWKLPEHAQPHVPWWLLVPAFLATELWPVRLQMRAEWASPRLWAAPLMVGLFYSTPLDLLVAFALAAAIAAGVRSPRRPVAMVSAAARAAVAVAVGFLVFTIASPLGIAQWEG